MSNKSIIDRLESKTDELKNGNLKPDEFSKFLNDSIEALEGIPYSVIAEMRDLRYKIEVAGCYEEEEYVSNIPIVIVELKQYIRELKNKFSNLLSNDNLNQFVQESPVVKPIQVKELANQQLQFRCSAKEYISLVQSELNESGSDYMPYWMVIPDYIIARCPICLEPYRQQIDTYSLRNWGIRHNMNNVKYTYRKYQQCEHFVGVHTFINLNGEKPTKSELLYGSLRSSEPEIPMVTPTLLPDDIESYVVLHSLPICRMWGDRFIPKYSLYLLTYYCANRWIPQERRELEWTKGHQLMVTLGQTNGPRMGIYWEEANQKPEAWDLAYWIDKGKLQWLDLTKLELPLNNDKDEFPYGKIEGVRYGYNYQDGQYEIIPTHPTLEEFKEMLKKQYPQLRF